MAKFLTVLLGASALCAASAAAASTTIDFTNPAGDVGSSTHTYSDGSGLSVTATGYVSNGGGTTNLFGKNAGVNEVGLGLTTDPAKQDEIYQGAFVQLDVSQLIGKVSSAMFAFGSTTLNETWAIFGSNSAGSFSGPALLTGTNDMSTHDLVSLGLNTNKFTYYDFVSLGTKTTGDEGPQFSAGNVLLGNITFTRSVPEPATWAMMLLGFGAIGVSFRRRKNIALAQIA